MLLLRFEIAKNRGFGEKINLGILAKMMLAEYYIPNFYKQLPAHLAKDGTWKEAKIIKDIIEKKITKNSTSKVDTSAHNENWFNLEKIKDWILLKPDITNIDLRPYYYACKEKIDYFTERGELNDLSEIVDILFKDNMIITQHIENLKKLSELQAEQVFDVIAQKIMESGNFEKEPNGIEGLKILTQYKIFLRKNLANFIFRLPKAEVGVWVITGWDKAIPSDCNEYNIIDKYLDELQINGNPIVQKTLKTVKRIK